MKRGQVSTFMVIGLVVLIVVGLAIYLLTESTKIELPDEPLENYDQRLNPLKAEVVFCLNSLGKEAFREIGLTGGYLEKPDALLTGLQPGYINEGIEQFPGSEIYLPYWYGVSSSPGCEDCRYFVEKPELEGPSVSSIDYQVSSYIEDNLLDCLDNFEKYNSIFELNPGEMNVNISFNEANTRINLEWPINASVRGSSEEFYIKNFGTELDLRFKKMYDLATDVFYQTILQQGALDIFAIQATDYLGLGEGVIPPRNGGTEYGFGSPRTWKMSEVQTEVSNFIVENINYLQIKSSRGSFQMIDPDPFRESIYSQFIYELYTDEEILSDTKIRFNYLNFWPTYVNTNPNYGELIMPETTTVDVPLFLLVFTKYQFNYDVSYPVIVTFEDDEAYDGEGYLFQFAVEGNIKGSSRYGEVNESATTTEPDERILSYGDPSQRTIPVKIRTIDYFSRIPVENVDITYTCLDQTITVGKTEFSAGEATLVTMMPPCIDGEFKANGEGIYGDSLTASVIEGLDNSYALAVYKEKEMDLRVKKKPVIHSPVSGSPTEFEWKLLDYTIASEADENMLLIMQRVENNEPSKYIKFLNFSGDAGRQKLGLIPGEYKVMLISLLNRTIITQEQTIKGVNIESVELNDSIVVGALNFDLTTSGYLRIKPEDLAENDNMYLYYAGYDPDDIVYTKDIEVMGKIFDFSATNRTKLLPTYD